MFSLSSSFATRALRLCGQLELSESCIVLTLTFQQARVSSADLFLSFALFLTALVRCPLTAAMRARQALIGPWTYYKWTVYGEPFFDLHDRHRHLVVCMLMSTSKRLDNDDYVIMQRHWQKKHFPPVRYNLAGVPLKIRLSINTTECSGAAKLKTLQFLWYDFENYWFAHFRTRIRVCPT